MLTWVLHCIVNQGCLVQVGNGIELDTVGRQFEPYRWRPCGVTWDVVPKQGNLKAAANLRLFHRDVTWSTVVKFGK